MQFVTHHVHHGLFAFTENTDGDDLYRCHTLKCMIPDAGSYYIWSTFIKKLFYNKTPHKWTIKVRESAFKSP